jgi:hypothetical protein
MRVSLLIAVLLASSLCGCSSKNASDPSDGGGDGGDIVGCGDSRSQTYAPGIQVTGASGIYSFAIASSQPSPPVSGTDVLVVKVLDASGQPVAGATLSAVTPSMPHMVHGTSTPTIASNADGSFTVSGVYLFMPGFWEIDMTAQSGSQKDTGSFFFCIVQ